MHVISDCTGVPLLWAHAEIPAAILDWGTRNAWDEHNRVAHWRELGKEGGGLSYSSQCQKYVFIMVEAFKL